MSKTNIEKKIKIKDCLIRVKNKDTGELGWVKAEEIIDGFEKDVMEVLFG